ncbi:MULTISPECIES: hypothetical protein [unclassified Caballeronia]|uniref:hypothetical protein n=1 Tax=unclassified Caballeronia TaxID=2646786 RepID=UPI00285BFAC1|nr:MULTISPECIES: hypothetical protein [unclassified Caballeronia]MDR5750199.1 hypothetical protein [Caballeronia sp. LZ024]MDR5842672.1 hypothetical protein [Caballeronia sp. LZ031]
MSAAAITELAKHLPVVLRDGTRTSISIPAVVYHAFLTRLGGDRATFNARLREAAMTAQPRPGVSRSLAVRFALEASLGEVTAPTQS